MDIELPGMDGPEAIANLSAFCRVHLPGRHKIEIVDVFREPKRALTDGMYMTPTPLELAPSPSCRLVGTLSQAQLVLQVLELEAFVA
jgi:circadian clock protein KaiB